MSNEVELKLETDSAGADAIETSEPEPRAWTTRQLHSRYFDTADFALRKAGLSLRLREGDGQRIQTVKADGPAGAGLHDRSEWELPVDGTIPVADQRTPLAEVLGERLGDLAECFTVTVQRSSCRVISPDGEIELAIDRGEVCAGERGEQFCEVELELVSGEPADLFGLAKELAGLAPVRLGVLTKPERGFRLLGALPASARAGELLLDPAMSLPEVFAAIAQHCISHYRCNEAIVLQRRSAEAVHQARVALRRLRSAFSLFRTLLPPSTMRQFQARLRALAATLGEARDLDVLYFAAEPGPLAQRLSAAREAAYTRVATMLAGEEPRNLMLDLASWLYCGDWRDDLLTAAVRAATPRQFAASALDRARRKVRKHGAHLPGLSPEARHELRKDAKKLRYATEFLESLYAAPKQRSRFKKFAKALAALQDELGALNDRDVAESKLARLGLADLAGAEALLGRWDLPGLLEAAGASRHKLLGLEPFWR